MVPPLSIEEVKSLVRDIPDFPKKGIVFKDITPALAKPHALAAICDDLCRPFWGKGITKVLAIESRGFFFGTGVAERLEAGLVPVRKGGKLPWETESQVYKLEYGEGVLEIHRDALTANDRVVIVDDVLATGGTLVAARALAERLGAKVLGAACFIEIGALKGRDVLKPTEVHTLWSV